MLNLDTHILLYAAAGKLSRREKALLAGARWCISSIVIWEIGRLHELGRIEISLDHPGLNALFERLHVVEISRHVIRHMLRLDFESDPADELIAATSLAHAIPLLTRDRKLLDSRIVPLA